jgi:hypothetical protein
MQAFGDTYEWRRIHRKHVFAAIAICRPLAFFWR